jgi:hypothetical protein
MPLAALAPGLHDGRDLGHGIIVADAIKERPQPVESVVVSGASPVGDNAA